MKCSIARDLMPLYADGLCVEQTEEELEAHFSECQACEALKNSFSAPRIAPTDILKINPFRKINKRMLLGKIAIILLCLLLAAVITTVGGLFYGELNKGSGWASFSGIARNIEVKSIAKYFAEGDIDSFAKYIDTDDFGEYSDILINRLKSDYNAELSGEKCRIASVSEMTSYNSAGAEEIILGNYVTFEFENAGCVTVLFQQSENSKYRVFAGSTVDLRTVKTMSFMGAFRTLAERAALISAKPTNFLAVFGMGRVFAISEKYDVFSADGSRAISAFASVPLYDEVADEFYSSCSIKFRDADGNIAVVELRALLGDENRFRADMNSVEITNLGMSEEKLAQALEIFAV